MLEVLEINRHDHQGGHDGLVLKVAGTVTLSLPYRRNLSPRAYTGPHHCTHFVFHEDADNDYYYFHLFLFQCL